MMGREGKMTPSHLSILVAILLGDKPRVTFSEEVQFKRTSRFKRTPRSKKVAKNPLAAQAHHIISHQSLTSPVVSGQGGRWQASALYLSLCWAVTGGLQQAWLSEHKCIRRNGMHSGISLWTITLSLKTQVS